MLARFILTAALAATPLLAQSPDTGTPPGGAPAKEKLICRREAPIGSMIASRKRCYTKAEWERIAEAARDTSTRMTTDNSGRPSGQ